MTSLYLLVCEYVPGGSHSQVAGASKVTGTGTPSDRRKGRLFRSGLLARFLVNFAALTCFGNGFQTCPSQSAYE
ncbi:hypothetical protein BsWGS_19687 [Bradybaena similaris]